RNVFEPLGGYDLDAAGILLQHIKYASTHVREGEDAAPIRCWLRTFETKQVSVCEVHLPPLEEPSYGSGNTQTILRNEHKTEAFGSRDIAAIAWQAGEVPADLYLGSDSDDPDQAGVLAGGVGQSGTETYKASSEVPASLIRAAMHQVGAYLEQGRI